MGNDYWDQRKETPYGVEYSAEAPIFLLPHDLDVKGSLLPVSFMIPTASQDGKVMPPGKSYQFFFSF